MIVIIRWLTAAIIIGIFNREYISRLFLLDGRKDACEYTKSMTYPCIILCWGVKLCSDMIDFRQSRAVTKVSASSITVITHGMRQMSSFLTYSHWAYGTRKWTNVGSETALCWHTSLKQTHTLLLLGIVSQRGLVQQPFLIWIMFKLLIIFHHFQQRCYISRIGNFHGEALQQ